MREKPDIAEEREQTGHVQQEMTLQRQPSVRSCSVKEGQEGQAELIEAQQQRIEELEETLKAR